MRLKLSLSGAAAQMSSTFSLIKLNNVNVTFLDNTNLRGYDGADMATLGKYKVCIIDNILP